MSNHLIKQSSPYLLQHAKNPVDWYPWCNEALERAKLENKPIFLSIGYSTCHWCHVMARESFENEAVAAVLNRYFISIKVDREERPDIDSVYMTFCQAFTGRGGWPMSIFLTPEQKPFFAGTYFPPTTQHGMIGFRDLLFTIAEKWNHDRHGLLQTAEQIAAAARDDTIPDTAVNDKLPEIAASLYSQTFDRHHGGFGAAPKFPAPHNLIFLILYSRLRNDPASADQAYKTLEQMRRGGIFDHIGYGFSRYSTDPAFLVPHFEKMLYDNALLILAYSVAYKASGRPEFLDTAVKTAEYILREMRDPDGGFYSAQDADSDGKEGEYYVWTKQEICEILGETTGNAFCRYYGITAEGNFEGKNIPNLLNGNVVTDAFPREREILYHHRKCRTKLHLDDKILTAWNALMITAMSVLYRVSGIQRYRDAAAEADRYIQTCLTRENTLYVSSRNGVLSVKGFLDEYAYDTAALLSLYDITHETAYLDRARQMMQIILEQFSDPNASGFFLYGSQNDSLITRPKETYDGALPSGNAVTAYCLVRLSQLTDHIEYRDAAQKQLAFLSAAAAEYPTGHSMFLTALLFDQNPPWKITTVLAPGDQIQEIISHLPLYADLQIFRENSTEYPLVNDQTTYYICRDHMCLPPVNEIREVLPDSLP